MKILIPMAGLGDRFQKAGYCTPKPMIEVEGQPMIAHVINRFSEEDEFIFAVNENHLDDGRIVKFLEGIAPNTRVLKIPYQPSGPVAVAQLLTEFVNDDEPVIVNYCDFSWAWDYQDFLRTMQDTECDAGFICYTGFHPNLISQALHATALEDDMWAHTVREKYSLTGNSFTDWTSSGTHYFKRGDLLKDYCKKLLADEKIAINGEYYISQIFEAMCNDQRPVRIYEIPFFFQWGKPEDYEEYVAWSNYYLKGELLPEMYSNFDERVANYWHQYFSSEYHESSLIYMNKTNVATTNSRPSVI